MQLVNVSFKDLSTGNPLSVYRQAALRAGGAIKDIGFLTISDFDDVLPWKQIVQFLELGTRVFAHGDERLMRYTSPATLNQEGFTPLGGESGDKYKRYWMTGAGPPHFLPNIFPNDLVPVYRWASEAMFQRCDFIGRRVMSAVGWAWGLPTDALAQPTIDGDSRLRDLEYECPPEGGIGACEHEDINWDTVVPLVKGLRVKSHGGELEFVEAREGRLVIDVGMLLSIYLRTQFGIDVPATTHDVQLLPGHMHRRTFAFFQHPRNDFIVDVELKKTAKELVTEKLEKIIKRT